MHVQSRSQRALALVGPGRAGTTVAAALATRCLTETGVVMTPGNGFGETGEGYIRLTLCSPVERLREAVERLRGLAL